MYAYEIITINEIFCTVQCFCVGRLRSAPLQLTTVRASRVNRNPPFDWTRCVFLSTYRDSEHGQQYIIGRVARVYHIVIIIIIIIVNVCSADA